MKSARKTNFLFIVILVLLTLPSQFLMLKEPIYPSHDGLLHIERIKQFDQSVKNWQIPPRIAPTLAGGIGFPMFVANYQLPYFFAEILMFLTNDPVLAFKGVLATTYILCSIFAFILFKNFGSNAASLVGAIIFSYTPYRFANLYTRGAFGESVSLMFVPLVLIGFHLIKKKSVWGFILLPISIFGLLTSHTVIFLLFFPFFLFYLLIIIKINAELLRKVVVGFLLGIGLSAFQLMPIIFERHYLKLDQTFFNIYSSHFVNFFQIMRIPRPGVNIGTPFQLGLTSTFLLIIGFFLFLKSRDRRLAFFLTCALVSVFFTQMQSLWLWQHIFFLKYIVFPWRFFSIIALSVGFISVLVTDRLKLKVAGAIVLIAITMFTSRHYFLKPTQYYSTLPSDLPEGPTEYETIWSNQRTYMKRNLIDTSGQAIVYKLDNKLFKITFSLEAIKDNEIVLRKLYFPGWKLRVNNLNRDIKLKDGLISFDVGPDLSNVVVEFGESNLRMLGNLMSLLTLVISILLIVGKTPGFFRQKIKLN